MTRITGQLRGVDSVEAFAAKVRGSVGRQCSARPFEFRKIGAHQFDFAQDKL